jgi:hypothetical protein
LCFAQTKNNYSITKGVPEGRTLAYAGLAHGGGAGELREVLEQDHWKIDNLRFTSISVLPLPTNEFQLKFTLLYIHKFKVHTESQLNVKETS